MTTTTTNAAAATTIGYSHLNKAGLTALVKERLGVTASKGWTMARMVEMLETGNIPASKGAKTELRAKYVAATGGIVAPKSWTVKKLATAMTAGQPVKLGGGSAVKKAIVAKYAAEMGVAPAKTWNAKTVAAKLESKVAPKSVAAGKRADGLTGVACKALIKAARDAGTVTAEATKGYYKLTADELRTMVATLNLSK